MNARAWLLYGLVLIAASLAVLAGGILATLPKPTIGVPAPSVVVQTGIPLLRWIANVCAIGAVGSWIVLVLLGAVGRDGSPALARRASVVAVWTAAAWTAAALLGLWFQAAQLWRSHLQVSLDAVVDYVAEVNLGFALLVSAGSATALTVLAIARVSRPSLPPLIGLLFALLGLMVVPMSGHASQGSPSWLLVTAIALHVGGASLWIGGLAMTALIVIADSQALAIVLARFSVVATVSFATVGASGLLLATTRLTADVTPHIVDVVDALAQTPAGWLVTGKLACMGVLGCSGAYIRRSVVGPAARQHPTSLPVWAGFELGVMTIAVALATALARPL